MTGRMLNTFALTSITGLLLSIGILPACARQAGEVETSVSARALQPGEVVQLDVTCSCHATAVTATSFGHAVPLAPCIAVRFGHGRALIGTMSKRLPACTRLRRRRSREANRSATRELAVVAKRFPTRRLTSMPASWSRRRARRSGFRTRRGGQVLFATVTPAPAWPASFHAPVTAPPASSFGVRSIFNGQASSPHGGTDFPSPTGTPIAAPAAGAIVLAEELFFTGNTVVIDHGFGLYSLLAHLSRLDVKAGDHVDEAQIVGLVGATGRVTGPHLHWAVRLGGARVDPLSLLAMAARTH